MKKIICGCLLVAVLGGCSWFGKEPLDIEGQRISVIRENKNLQPDYTAGQVKIKLPRAHVNSSWSQNGNNSLHSGGHLKAGGNLDELWTHSFGDGSSKRDVLISSPVAENNVVFAIDARGEVSAFRLDNGDELWQKRLKPANREAKSSSIIGAGLAVYDNKVFATTGYGVLYALDATSGDIIWEQDLKAPLRIAPTVNDELVIAQTLDNAIFAIKIASGEILWKDKVEAESTTMIGGASPAYSPSDDLVVAAFSNGQIQAYKASTGTLLWTEWLSSANLTESLADITSVKANPVIDDGKVLVVGYNAPLAAIDIRTGVKIWQKEIASANQPWVAGKFLFVLTNEGDLAAIDKQNGKIVWTTIIPYADAEEENIGVFTSGPILANDALLVVSSNGKLFSVSPYNGRIMGIANIEEGVETAPILVNETLILTTRDAEMTAYM